MERKDRSENYFVLELPSRPENVAFARQCVAMFAAQLDFTIDEIDEIKVAVSEVASNVVIHAYGGQVGLMRIEARLADGELEVSVTDFGSGIADVAWATQATHTTRPDERMGLGLVFVKEYMDELHIDSQVGRGTTVRMKKRVKSRSLNA